MNGRYYSASWIQRGSLGGGTGEGRVRVMRREAWLREEEDGQQ